MEVHRCQLLAAGTTKTHILSILLLVDPNMLWRLLVMLVLNMKYKEGVMISLSEKK